MWCSACQQDVPALGAASEGTLRCGKCDGWLAHAEQSETSTAAAPPLGGPPGGPPGGRGFRRADASRTIPTLAPHARPESVPSDKNFRATALTEEDWVLEAELRGVQRLLDSLKTRPTQFANGPSASNAYPPPPEVSEVRAVTKKRTERRYPAHQRQTRLHLAAWTILSIGLAVFACGAVLLAWSLVAGRNDLWPLGLPLTLIGQAALILGIVLQLDGLCNSSRQTAEVLSELDDELKSVREATCLLSTTPPTAPQPQWPPAPCMLAPLHRGTVASKP